MFAEKVIEKNINKMVVLFFMSFWNVAMGLYVSMALPYIFCRYVRFVMTIYFNKVEYTKMYWNITIMLKIGKFGTRYYTTRTPTKKDSKNIHMQLQKSVERTSKDPERKLWRLFWKEMSNIFNDANRTADKIVKSL